MRTFWPGWIRPWSRRPMQGGVGRHRHGRRLLERQVRGFGASSDSVTQTYSAKPPCLDIANTSSPGRNSVTSRRPPRPAPPCRRPGRRTSARAARGRRRPSAARRTAVLSCSASRTAGRRWHVRGPAPRRRAGTGLSRSVSSRTSGEPYERRTNAFMACSSKRDGNHAMSVKVLNKVVIGRKYA